MQICVLAYGIGFFFFTVADMKAKFTSHAIVHS